MGWTKKQLIQAAFGGIGLSDFTFNVDPDEKQSALGRLDSMMATWNAKGIRLGYALPSSPDNSNLDDDSGLPDFAIETVIANLELRLAPGFGKTVSSQTQITAKDGYSMLLARAAFPPEQQFPRTLPRGAGNKPWRGGLPRPFMPTPTDPLMGAEGGDQIDLE